MNILITGASGFLGSALALHFQSQGNDVALLIRQKSSLKRLKGVDRKFLVRRHSTLGEIAPFVTDFQPTVVIHAACSYGRNGETKEELKKTNFEYGVQLIEVLSSAGVPLTFINIGTSLHSDVSPYALSKNEFSEWGVKNHSETSKDIKFINLKLEHIYGPGDDYSKFATYVIHSCNNNVPEIKLTAGQQLRDFIYISDVISAISKLIDERSRLKSGFDISLGSGKAISIRKLVETIHEITKSNTKLLFGELPYRKNEVMHSQANIEYMKTLGWVPEVSMEMGIKRIMKIDFEVNN